MIELQIQNVFNYLIYPRASEIYSDKGFINFDDGGMGGTHWMYFYKQHNELFYFDSFEGAPDKFSLTNYLKQIYIIIIKYKI